MRNHVTFRHPAEFVSVSEDEGVLDARDASWFVALLNRIAHVSVHRELFQESWGVTAITERMGKRFWIGLEFGHSKHWWHAQFSRYHHTWTRNCNFAERDELARLVADFHLVLASDPSVEDIAWYFALRAGNTPSPTPDAPIEALQQTPPGAHARWLP